MRNNVPTRQISACARLHALGMGNKTALLLDSFLFHLVSVSPSVSSDGVDSLDGHFELHNLS